MDKLNTKQKIISGKKPFEHVVKIKTETNGWGLLKALIVLLLFAIEIAFLVLQTYFFVSLISFYTIFSTVCTVITCIYVLSSNKNSQSKAVWILFLIVSYNFGYIIYWISDERVFFRSGRKRFDKIFNQTKIFVDETTLPENLSPVMKQSANYLKNAGNFPAYSGTKSEYYSSGSAFFDEMLEQLKKAEHFIFFDYYIISDGILFQRMEKILVQKAKAGVEIRIIFDDMGSFRTFSHKTRRRLKEAGIKIYGFNQLISWFSVGLNYRDHRKICVIDGKVAFTGGANIADEYINSKRMHGYWKDSGIKIQGDAVDSMTLCFLRNWEYISKAPTNYSEYLGHSEHFSSKAVYIPFAEGLEYRGNIAKDTFVNLISNAKQKIYIMTPYFIVDDVVLELLKAKAMAGVDVRIILPAVPDKKTVYRVTRNTTEKLINFGVKVYILNNSFVHSKVILTEDATVVGTINFDLRSFYQQYENAILTNDTLILKQVQKDFSNVISASTEITEKNMSRKKPVNRIVAGILGIISPFM